MQNLNPLSNQPTKTDKNWLIIFVVASTVIILTSITFNIATNKIAPTQVNTLNSATPGYKFTPGIQEGFGTLLEVKDTELGKEYNYKSEFPTYNTKVVVSNDNKVLFIDKREDFNPKHTLGLYVNEFGEPQLILNYVRFGNPVKANVFLNAGLVVFAHIKDGTVQAIWRFEPTSEEKFLNSWGKELTIEETGPSVF